MRKKFQALQKDIEEQREQLTLQHEQQKELYNTIKGEPLCLASRLIPVPFCIKGRVFAVLSRGAAAIPLGPASTGNGEPALRRPAPLSTCT